MMCLSPFWPRTELARGARVRLDAANPELGKCQTRLWTDDSRDEEISGIRPLFPYPLKTKPAFPPFAFSFCFQLLPSRCGARRRARPAWLVSCRSSGSAPGPNFPPPWTPLGADPSYWHGGYWQIFVVGRRRFRGSRSHPGPSDQAQILNPELSFKPNLT